MTGEEVHPGSAPASRSTPAETLPAPDVAAAELQPSVSSASVSRVGRLKSIVAGELSNLQPRLRLASLLLFFMPPHSLGRTRTLLYRLLGFSIGPKTLILGSLQCTGWGRLFHRLRVGERCILNWPLHLDLNGDITIGSRVCIGHHVVLITTDHEVQTARFRCGRSVPKPIVIEDGCWIGACATILPGVTIGAGSVVSAGAVVSTDVPPNKVVAGNPARPVKTLTD